VSAGICATLPGQAMVIPKSPAGCFQKDVH
jgi:hypothetical protein